jgi:hypothetical protein
MGDLFRFTCSGRRLCLCGHGCHGRCAGDDGCQPLFGHKRGWDDRWEEFATWAEKGAEMQKRLLALVDEDTEAYNGILKAFEMPKKSEEEKAARAAAVEVSQY